MSEDTATCPAYRYERIAEGFCPVLDHGRLDREALPGSGWCDACGIGWSTKDGEVSLHYAPQLRGVS